MRTRSDRLYHRSISLPSKELILEIKRQSRKTLAIHVLTKDQIEVRAPLKCPWTEIDRFIEEKLSWIVDAQGELARLPPPPRYVEGASHAYLGSARRLNLITGKPTFVAADADTIVIRCVNPAAESLVKRHLEEWYGREAQRHLPGRIESLNQQFRDGVELPRLRLRRMRARWGSCDGRGELCINSLVMQKPLPAVDLVLAHELCHLRHFGHDKDFYQLLTKVMPDWQAREKYLD